MQEVRVRGLRCHRECLRGARAAGVGGEGGGHVCGFAINITFRKKLLLCYIFWENIIMIGKK